MGLKGKEIKKICSDVDFPFLLRDDFLIPVLIRLPIVSLLRFKSVCKYWCTLIETSFFTHLLHTSNSSSSSSASASNFGTFILQASVIKYAVPFDKYAGGLHVTKMETEIIIVSSESEESGSGFRFRSGPRSGSSGWCWSTDDDDGKVYGSKEDDDHVFKVDDDDDDDNLVLKLDRLGVPSCYKFSLNWSQVVMVGSCNGLICLYDKEHKEVTLWNPATRQFRILPKPITTIENHGGITCVLGFGFDIKTKDYKVVLLGGDKNVVQVYSLSTDSWRLLEGIHSLPGRLMLGLIHGLYVNGSCFFMATYHFPVGYNRWFLVSFDFTKEIITTMEFPDRHHDDHMTQGFYLTYFGGDKMALFVLRPPPHAGYYHDYENCDYDYNDCDIWVLNEHHGMNKEEESWTKLHSFQIKKRVYEKIIPRGISNNGEFALLQAQAVGPLGSHRYGLNRKMKLYNLVTKETKKEFLSCSLVMSGAAVYKPSIVSIKGGQAYIVLTNGWMANSSGEVVKIY